MRRLDDSAVMRRIGSERTHVARVGAVRVERFLNKPYWTPTLGAEAACGVSLPPNSVIMMTGTKVYCRTCVHLTGTTEQSPSVHERLGTPT